MKFELFKADFGNFWGVRRVGEQESMFFDQYWQALCALNSIESWIEEAVANAIEGKELSKNNVEVSNTDATHTTNALKALENYNLVKSDEVVNYEKGIRG